MIFYRTEILRTSGSLKTNYDIQVEIKPGDSGSAEITEAYLNEQILEKECSLRSILSFEDTYVRNHFFILQKITKGGDDRMITVNRFSS
jgi:hypothetical protein